MAVSEQRGAVMEERRVEPVPQKTSIAGRILDLLAAEGIDTLFGIPDPGIQAIFREAKDRGWTLVAPHHEAAGGFMADAWSRMTGKPAIINGNQGPGVANLMPAAICASKENVPVIFLAEQRSRRLDSQVKRGKFQYTPQPRFFEAAMKYVGIIEFPQQVDEIFREAFRQALSGKPGPVYIEYPEDHVNAELEAAPVLQPEQYRLTRQLADPDAVARAADLIAKAENPLILAGTAINRARAHEAFLRLARQIGCPVLTTPGGRGALPETDPQLLLYSGEAADKAIEHADVVLAIGTSIGEQMHSGSTHHWNRGKTDRKWIHLERDVANIGVNRLIDVPLVGDLRDVIPQLCESLHRAGGRAPSKLLTEWRAGQQQFRHAMIAAAPETVPIHPGRMIAEVMRNLPDDTVHVMDGGCTSLWNLAYGEIRSNDSLGSAHFGMLGVGLPYAIGAQLAVGDRRRVCLITGDSAFQFHIAELETAVRKKLPIVVIVNSDAAWGMEHPGFHEQFGPGKDVEVRWGTVRFDRIAEGFGAHGEYVDRTEDIGPAVRRALAAGRPAVVQVAVDPEVNALQAPNWAEFVTWYGGFY